MGVKKNTSNKWKEVKNKKIAESMAATRIKRENQVCKVYELKLNSRRMNSIKRESIFMMFVEGKWMYNDVLNSGKSPSEYDDKTKTVCVKYPDGFHEHELTHLSASMKQSLLSRMNTSIKSLSTNKKNGSKVGRLKFISKYNSIELKQYGKTHKIDFSRNRIKIQNIPGWMRVRGLHQIPKDADIANAMLVKRASGYYLMLTTYLPKPESYDKAPETVIGVDMGVATSLTLSNGYKFSAYVQEPEKLTRLKRKMSRQEKNSSSYEKTRNKIRRLYETMDNKKDDVSNKIVCELLNNDMVFFQDEMLSQWKRRWGRKIHYGVLGRVKSKLEKSSKTYMLDRSEATTQTCTCGKRNKLPLSQRTYSCECGRTLPRDIHSAQMMVIIGRKLVPMGCREFTLVENADSWSSQQFHEHSAKPEASTLSVLR